jgi:hypothetical protein
LAEGKIARFAFVGTRDEVGRDIAERCDYTGPLRDIYIGMDDGLVHKWHHYLPLYDRYFARFRDRPVRFLEIGVSKGGSLVMWRRFFGAAAVIYGVDINRGCARFDGQAGQVRIGSQDDMEFMQGVVAEMGGVDVILDDGSHHMPHVRASLAGLFPLLSEGGLYVIEDMHTAFWRSYGGGYHAPGNVFRLMAEVVADMHHWYHDKGMVHPDLSGVCRGIHIHDSLIVLEKGEVRPPAHSRVG